VDTILNFLVHVTSCIHEPQSSPRLQIAPLAANSEPPPGFPDVMAPRINIPPVTRAILSSLCALSFLYGFARWRQLDHGPGASSHPLPVPYLALVPSQFLLYPWTLAISTFVEQNIFTLVINGATVFYGGKYLERAWGSREFGKFILVVSLVSNVAITFLYLSWASITGQSTVAYASSFSLSAVSYLILLTHLLQVTTPSAAG